MYQKIEYQIPKWNIWNEWNKLILFFYRMYSKMDTIDRSIRQQGRRGGGGSNAALTTLAKGHLNSEWIYEVTVSPKMQTINYKDFCPTLTRIVTLFFGWCFGQCRNFFDYDPCLFDRTEILVIFGLHFGRNNDLINLFWI